MGYGQRAMEILEKYYEGSIPSLSEESAETKQEAEVVDSKVNQKCSLGIHFNCAGVHKYTSKIILNRKWRCWRKRWQLGRTCLLFSWNSTSVERRNFSTWECHSVSLTRSWGNHSKACILVVINLQKSFNFILFFFYLLGFGRNAVLCQSTCDRHL